VFVDAEETAMGVALVEHRGGPWTIEDVEALPDTGNGARYELLAPGVLTVSPAPGTMHQRVSRRLANLLERGAVEDGAPVEVLENVNLALPKGRLAQPDVVVADRRFAAADPVRYPAEYVRAVVEIVSPSSEAQDRVLKPRLYAEAGIGVYWRFELAPEPHLVVFQLRKGRFVRACTAPAGASTRVELPFPVELDPAEVASQ
jgi:Uma2 family endonuclease